MLRKNPQFMKKFQIGLLMLNFNCDPTHSIEEGKKEHGEEAWISLHGPRGQRLTSGNTVHIKQ
jgi:hypothetical protein